MNADNALKLGIQSHSKSLTIACVGSFSKSISFQFGYFRLQIGDSVHQLIIVTIIVSRWLTSHDHKHSRNAVCEEKRQTTYT